MHQQLEQGGLWTACCLLALVMLAGCSGGPGNPAEPETAGSPLRAKLVTTEQYQNSLAYIFGPSVDVRVQFAPPQRREDERSESDRSGGGANSAAASPSGASPVPDPEVAATAKRRRFTAEYKLSILSEVESCQEQGEIGAQVK